MFMKTNFQRREWELSRLKDTIELDESKIDPAPFQLVRYIIIT